MIYIMQDLIAQLTPKDIAKMIGTNRLEIEANLARQEESKAKLEHVQVQLADLK